MATSFLEDQANGTYYDGRFDYRMSYSPIVSQTTLALFYAESKEPAPIGRGFDRWFVFLRKAGVARGTILGLLAAELAGVFFFTWQLEGMLETVRLIKSKSGSDLPRPQGTQSAFRPIAGAGGTRTCLRQRHYSLGSRAQKKTAIDTRLEAK